MNQLNKTKTRHETEATANNIEHADCLLQETVAGRHYQQNTNHAAVQRQKQRMHISAGCSTDCQACDEIYQVDYHHHFNAIEDYNQLSENTPHEDVGVSFYSTCNYDGNNSDSSSLVENNDVPDLSGVNIGCQVVDLSKKRSFNDEQSFDCVTVSKYNDISPTNLVSSSRLSKQ